MYSRPSWFAQRAVGSERLPELGSRGQHVELRAKFTVFSHRVAKHPVAILTISIFPCG